MNTRFGWRGWCLSSEYLLISPSLFMSRVTWLLKHLLSADFVWYHVFFGGEGCVCWSYAKADLSCHKSVVGKLLCMASQCQSLAKWSKVGWSKQKGIIRLYCNLCMHVLCLFVWKGLQCLLTLSSVLSRKQKSVLGNLEVYLIDTWLMLTQVLSSGVKVSL